MQTIKKSGNGATLALKWLNWADTDYVAARQLLRSGRIVPGTVLANTALEKYLKTLFIMFGLTIPRSHDVRDLYARISPNLKRYKLNEEFLEFLYKAYKLRYPDDLEPGYNICLCFVKILTELDFSVFKIREGFNFKTSEGATTTPFDHFIKEKSVQLLDKNCYFSNYSRIDFFAETSDLYELRVLPNGDLIEVIYLAKNIVDDGKFIVEALKSEISPVPKIVETI